MRLTRWSLVVNFSSIFAKHDLKFRSAMHLRYSLNICFYVFVSIHIEFYMRDCDMPLSRIA